MSTERILRKTSNWLSPGLQLSKLWMLILGPQKGTVTQLSRDAMQLTGLLDWILLVPLLTEMAVVAFSQVEIAMIGTLSWYMGWLGLWLGLRSWLFYVQRSIMVQKHSMTIRPDGPVEKRTVYASSQQTEGIWNRMNAHERAHLHMMAKRSLAEGMDSMDVVWKDRTWVLDTDTVLSLQQSYGSGEEDG